MDAYGSTNYKKDGANYLLIALLVVVAVILIGVLLYFAMANPNGGINNNSYNLKNNSSNANRVQSNKNGDQKFDKNLNEVEPENISGESVEMSIPSNNNRNLSQGETISPDEIMVEEIKENSSNVSEDEIFVQKDKKHNLISAEEQDKNIYIKEAKIIRNNPKSEHYKNKNYYSGETSFPKSS